MTHKVSLFVFAAALMLAAPVVQAADVSATTKTEYKQDSDGGYESKKTIKKENADGTLTKEESNVDVERNGNGNYEKTVEHKSTNDPKGLMNRSTAKTTETVKSEDGKTEYRHKKEVDGETVEDETTVEQKN